jgi:hypothetical protein
MGQEPEMQPEDKIVIDGWTALSEEAAALATPVDKPACDQWIEQMKKWREDPPATRGAPPAQPPFMSAFAAICLSGGGIRSAAFCLGVIQAFAARGMLKQFHYLSTVSGGGYIGGWLTRCIAAWKGDVEKVETQLNVYQVVQADGALNRRDRIEPPELRRLRRYTNFLTPDPGLASTDTWAAVMLWLRNTVINWTVFSPVFLVVAGVPVLYYALICLAGSAAPGSTCFWAVFCVLGAVSLGFIGFANYQICINLPTHKQVDYEGIDTGERGFGLNGSQIFCWIGLWSLLWTFLAPLAVAPLLSPPDAPFGVHAAFWGRDGAPPPACGQAPDHAFPAKPQLPPLAKIPRLSTLVPAGLRHYVSVPVLRQRTALCLLPIMLWLVYQAAFYLAWWTVKCRYKNDEQSASNALREAEKRDAQTPQNDLKKSARMAEVREKREALENAREHPGQLLKDNMDAFKSNQLPWMLSGAFGASLLLVGMRLDFGRSALWLALAGPLWITGMEFLRSAVYVAVRKAGIYTDLDREWLARISGDKFRFAAGVCAIGTAAVFLPGLVLDNFSAAYTSVGALVTLFGGGTITAFLGQSARTMFTHGVKSADDSSFWTVGRLIMLAAILFGILLFVIAGRLDVLVADSLDAVLFPQPYKGPVLSGSPGINQFIRMSIILVVTGVAFALLAIMVNLLVNLNRFSMHAVYRNRIIRAFLGTARAWFASRVPASELAAHQNERIPNRYTGFGAQDNMRMADTFPRAPDRLNKLFLVIGTTLNRTTGKDTARAARKGEPFTITPLHCGAPSLQRWQGAYVRTKYYAGGDKETGTRDKENGITLGTAMAISGAAVSPNMGYNSSPFTAFLMTLFNLRLGAWLPNPAARERAVAAMENPKKAEDREKKKEFFKRAGPRWAILTLLWELTGQANDAGDYIYLSDGGHFDNLGLYEMLRRRCGYIVVVDAGADKEFKYFDLGHTLEMASIDLGVKISFSTNLVCGKEPVSPAAAYATITYPPDALAGLPGATGQLIYIKPFLPDEAPIELRSYQKIKEDFPHEPTEDQFFTESDFESYRRLGELVANTMLTKLLADLPAQDGPVPLADGPVPLATVFARAAQQPPPDAAPAALDPKQAGQKPAKQQRRWRWFRCRS